MALVTLVTILDEFESAGEFGVVMLDGKVQRKVASEVDLDAPST